MQAQCFLLPPNRFSLLPSPPPSSITIPTPSPATLIRCTSTSNTTSQPLPLSISDADLAARGIRVRRCSAGLDLEALNAVFARVGFPRREASRLRLALEHTDALVWLEENGDRGEGAPVAFARATGDGVFNAVVWDVVVDPALQGTGLGKAIMERLLGDLRDRGIVNIALYAEPKVVGFYRMLGFAGDPDGIKDDLHTPIALASFSEPLKIINDLLHTRKDMTGRTTFKRAKKVVSRGDSSRQSDTLPTPGSTCEQTREGNEFSGTQHSPHRSTSEQIHTPNDGIWLIDEQGIHVRRRGRTTCIDIQNMPSGTRVHIEVNENNVPSNISESVLLGSYLGVIARDPVLAPLNFKDWRNKGLEPYKKKMLAEVESKFAFPGHIRHWILQSLGVKWRNHKSNLKAEHWDSRPIEEIMESIPAGVDGLQWCQLVAQWSDPKDKERALKNTANAKKQTCPHTMGRVSSVRRQQEMAIKDRLLLWRINRLHKDGTWSSEDAEQRWMQACELLAEDGLTPEDGNLEANERVFNVVMGPEHPGRVRTQGFDVTPTRYFPHSTNGDKSSNGSNLTQIVILEKR